MKIIIAILTAIIYCLLCSCYTKNQAIKKFCRQDTISTFVTVTDTLYVPSEKADTVFTASPCDTTGSDSVTVQNGKVSATYQRKGRKIHLQANYLGDTTINEKIVEVKAPCNCPPCPELPKPTFWDKLILYAKNALSLIGIVVLVIIGFRYIIGKLGK